MKTGAARKKISVTARVGAAIGRVSKLRLLLLGLVTCFFIVEFIDNAYVVRTYPFMEPRLGHFEAWMIQPFTLLVAAVCLTLKRLWGVVIALAIAANILYTNVFRLFLGISNAYGIAPTSMETVRVWFRLSNSTLNIKTAFAILILIIAIVDLSILLSNWIRGLMESKGELRTIRSTMN